MTGAPTYLGQPLDAETALALLAWQAEMGADEPILDAPVNRFEAPDPAPAPAAPAPAAATPAPPPEAEGHEALVAQAAALADGAATLEALAGAQAGMGRGRAEKGRAQFRLCRWQPPRPRDDSGRGAGR